MLESIALRNLRAYKDTDDIALNKLNIMLGANNAGKTTFMSAVEAICRARSFPSRHGILPLSDMPQFNSFDSALRRHWSPNEPRAKEFCLSYVLGDARPAKSSSSTRITVSYGSAGDDNTPLAKRIAYEGRGFNILLDWRSEKSASGYSLSGTVKSKKVRQVTFHNLLPFAIPFAEDDSAWSSALRRLMVPLSTSSALEIVSPSRPSPRSAYVLDDANLNSDDRELISYLISTFASRDADDIAIKRRIVESLNVIGLATDFDVQAISNKISSKIVALRVSPTNKRQKVTIADVGFGLSQVLPLVVKDARLSNGTLIAYQPEVHLHPSAQSRLADIFAASVARGNQVFVETHSPDLILRIQLLISQGVISHHDVSVFCFENSAGQSKIDVVQFGPNATPSMRWPDGFLDTSFNLSRELSTSRVRGATK